MKKFIVTTMLVVGMGLGLSAQFSPSSRVQFDIQAGTLSDANGYTYRAYIDGAAGVEFPATCVDALQAGLFTCTSVAPLPALTIGAHTLQLTAANVAGEGDRSSTFSFTVVASPNVPANIRLVP